jgi:hypothetical protein
VWPFLGDIGSVGVVHSHRLREQRAASALRTVERPGLCAQSASAMCAPQLWCLSTRAPHNPNRPVRAPCLRARLRLLADAIVLARAPGRHGAKGELQGAVPILLRCSLRSRRHDERRERRIHKLRMSEARVSSELPDLRSISDTSDRNRVANSATSGSGVPSSAGHWIVIEPLGRGDT